MKKKWTFFALVITAGILGNLLVMNLVSGFDETLDITTPLDSEDTRYGAMRIREAKEALQERLNIDHVFNSYESTASETAGYHKAIHFLDESSAPETTAYGGVLYGYGGGLYFKDTSGNITHVDALELREATVIVAASNSKSTTAADYVCDGLADEVQIESAIADLPSGGGRVLLLEGTYYISSQIDISKSYTKIEGQGYSTVLQLIDSANCDVFDTNIGASYVIYENFKIDGNSAGQSANKYGIDTNNPVRIQNVKFYDIRGTGVALASSGSCICNCEFDKITKYAIYGGALGNQLIANNRFSNITDYAICLLSSAAHCLLTNNIFESSVSYSILVTGDYNAVLGNKCGAANIHNSGNYNYFSSNYLYSGTFTDSGLHTDTTSVNYGF